MQTTHAFEGLGELKEVQPQLAQASAHPVYVDPDNVFNPEGNESIGGPRQVDHQAIWNSRDDRLSYIGSEKYEITQHNDIINYITDAVNATVGEIDIGRIRDYGERIDGMITLEGHNVDVGELVGDGYVPPESEILDNRTASVEDAKASDGSVRDILGVGIRFGNSFDASERIRIETMGYRFICQNWLIWGKETIGTYEQLHINELDAQNVEDLIFDILDKQEQIEGIVKDTATDTEYPLSWAIPSLKEIGFGPRQSKHILQVLRDYGTVDDSFSRWELYNAVTAYLDHDVVADVNANVYDRHQGKAAQLLTQELSSPSEDELEASAEILQS